MRVTLRPSDDETVAVRIEGITPGNGEAPAAAEAGREPSPEDLLAASLASCTATTMELYARRKGWELGELEVDADYTPAQRGSPTRCTIVVRLPDDLPAERRERLMQVGATSPVHRTLEGEIVFDERVELTTSQPGPGVENTVPSRRRRHIALLNGLRKVPQHPQA